MTHWKKSREIIKFKMLSSALLVMTMVLVAASTDMDSAAAAARTLSHRQHPAGGRTITPQQFFALSPGQVKLMPNGMPKVLHQTWRSSTLLPKHQLFFDSWERCLPRDWIHVLWTDDDAMQFVETKAPYWFIPTIRLYHHPIQLVDIFRYVLLSKVGGLYSDLDNECKATPDFASLPQRCEVFLAETCCNSSNLDQDGRMRASLARWEKLTGRPRSDQPPGTQNSLMGSRPGHPFWLWVLALGIENGPRVNWLQSFLQPIHSTVGVDLLSMAHYQYRSTEPDGKSVCELPALDWHGLAKDGWVGPPPKFVYHHGTHVWRSSSKTAWMITSGIVRWILLPIAVLVLLVRSGKLELRWIRRTLGLP